VDLLGLQEMLDSQDLLDQLDQLVSQDLKDQLEPLVKWGTPDRQGSLEVQEIRVNKDQ